MSQENVLILREMYGRRTVAEAAELMHPAAEMRQPSALPNTDEYYGREELVRGTGSPLRLGVISISRLTKWSISVNVPLGGCTSQAAVRRAALSSGRPSFTFGRSATEGPGVVRCSLTRTLPSKQPGCRTSRRSSPLALDEVREARGQTKPQRADTTPGIALGGLESPSALT
jgi:hypothetical protein